MINTVISVIVKGNNTASMTIEWSYRSSNGVMVWQHQWQQPNPTEKISVKIQWQQQEKHIQL